MLYITSQDLFSIRGLYGYRAGLLEGEESKESNCLFQPLQAKHRYTMRNWGSLPIATPRPPYGIIVIKCSIRGNHVKLPFL